MKLSLRNGDQLLQLCSQSGYRRWFASKSKANTARYIQRQLTDEFARKAREHSYRARSAFKLLEINERFKIIRPGMAVLDVGAAPGSWCQVLKQLVEIDKSKNGLVIGVDIQPMEPIPGVTLLDMHDIFARQTLEKLRQVGCRSFGAVASDMAPNPCGNSSVDHERIVSMCDRLLQLCVTERSIVLAKGGTFLCKIWDGPNREHLVERSRQHFQNVRFIKPKASREHSAEMYLVATKRF